MHNRFDDIRLSNARFCVPLVYEIRIRLRDPIKSDIAVRERERESLCRETGYTIKNGKTEAGVQLAVGTDGFDIDRPQDGRIRTSLASLHRRESAVAFTSGGKSANNIWTTSARKRRSPLKCERSTTSYLPCSSDRKVDRSTRPFAFASTSVIKNTPRAIRWRRRRSFKDFIFKSDRAHVIPRALIDEAGNIQEVATSNRGCVDISHWYPIRRYIPSTVFSPLSLSPFILFISSVAHGISWEMEIH